MATTITSSRMSSVSAAGRARRPVGVLLAVAASLLTWLVLTTGLGIDLAIIGRGAISWPSVGVAGLVAGLAGWAALGVLERAGAPAGRWWTVLAVTVLALSLPAPVIQGEQVADRVGLVVLHLVLGVVLIPILAGSARR